MHIDHELMKQSNRSRILNVIYQKKKVTRQEISRILNVSLPTVVSNVADMVKEGILEEAGMATSTGGRKPMIIKFVPNGRYSIGIELKPHKARIILTDLASTIIDQGSLRWDTLIVDDVMKELSLLVEEIIQKNNIPKNKLLGVGFALPGVMDEETLRLENAPNLGASNIDFTRYQSLFPAQIYIENEANTAAYAEAMLTDESHNSNLIFLSITEGIGAGIMIQNQLYKGSNKKAGEFGHMRISMEKEKCSCGRYGCWEVFSSEKALQKRYKAASGQMLTLDEIIEKVQVEEDVAQKVFTQYIDYLVMGIENIILAFSPKSIVIGGHISQYEPVIMPLIKERLGKEKTIYEISETKVVCSKLGNQAPILGAALLPIHDLFYYEKVVI